jgi:lipopolysaccharide transport system permease protein
MVYTPESPLRHPGRLAAAMLRDLVASRELAWRLFIRDFSSQYRQSLLGYFWVFVPPLVAALPWLYLSSQDILKAGSTGIPYVAYVLAGTTLWSAFTDALNCPASTLSGGRAMMSKINFPREALIVAGLGQMLVNLLIRLVLVLAVLLFVRVPLGAELALAPLGVAAVVIAGLALGMLTAPVSMLYGDVNRAIGFFTMFWMILTPVVYVPSGRLSALLARWNPASPLIVTARDFLTCQPPEHLAGFLWVTGAALVLLVVGWFACRLTLPIIVERMGG